MAIRKVIRCKFCDSILNLLDLEQELQNLQLCSVSCKLRYFAELRRIAEHNKEVQRDVSDRVAEIIKRTSSLYF